MDKKHGEKPMVQTIRPGENLLEGVWCKMFLDDAQCAFGDTYTLYLKRGRSDHLAIMLSGGGLTWNTQTAAMPGFGATMRTLEDHFYLADVEPWNDTRFFGREDYQGLLSCGEENLFSDWSVCVICYATGDCHLGNGDYTFLDKDGVERVLHHWGYRNFQMALKQICGYFPQPKALLFCGQSAGASGIPALAGEVIQRYIQCPNITVLADSALLLREDWRDVMQHQWHTPTHILNAVQGNDTVLDFFSSLCEQYGQRAKYLLSCGVQDHMLAKYQNFMDHADFYATASACAAFQQSLAKQVKGLRSVYPPFGFYIHTFPQDEEPCGDQHCTLMHPTFAHGKTDGVSPMQWLMDAVNGNVYSVGLSLLE